MLLNTIAALREGDTFVFQQVFAQYHEKLYFYTLGKTKSSYLAEETVQLTFIKLWRCRSSLNPEISLSIQLFRIARTTLIDLLRSKEYNNRIFVEMSLADKNPLRNHVDERIDELELKEKVLRGVEQMPAMRRKIFKLSRFDGMSYKEIAVELSLSVKTVEHHISLALKQLQHIISILAPLLLFFRK
jgi:RNA polymerase sigma-70 factor (family 1)